MNKTTAFRRRSPDEVFAHHAKAGEHRDLEAYVSDFSPRSILITPHHIYLGRKGVRQWLTQFWEQLEGARFRALLIKKIGCAIFVRYKCKAQRYRIDDGVATFIVANGYFSVLTNHYTLTPISRRKLTKR